MLRYEDLKVGNRYANGKNYILITRINGDFIDFIYNKERYKRQSFRSLRRALYIFQMKLVDELK